MSPAPVKIVAGNWKMHHGPTAAAEFFDGFLPRWPARADRTVVFFPPALSLAAARRALRGRPDLQLGVQNVYWEETGAFTGEVSAPMARDAGAAAALVGHSERRHVFGETSADTARKTAAVLAAGLTAVLCVGETLEQRRAGAAARVVAEQLGEVVRALDASAAGRLWIAYEPVWAIGTGVTAAPEDAREMHAEVRRHLEAAFPGGAAVPILYGGSVKPDNAAELLATPGVDGLLVGGASLDAAGFAGICGAAA